jgi:hypothetical protein
MIPTQYPNGKLTLKAKQQESRSISFLRMLTIRCGHCHVVGHLERQSGQLKICKQESIDRIRFD